MTRCEADRDVFPNAGLIGCKIGFGGHMFKTLMQEFDGHQLWSSSGLRTDHNGLPLLCFSGCRSTNDGVGRDHTVGEGGRCNAVTKRMIAALIERMREAQFERFRTTVMHDNADGRIAKGNCMTALRKLDNGPQSRP